MKTSCFWVFFGHFERSEDVTFSFSSLQISLVNGNFTDFYEGDLSEKHKFLDYLGGVRKFPFVETKAP